MGTEVTRDLRLEFGVVQGSDQNFAFAEKVFLGHVVLALDDVKWDCDMSVIRSALIKKNRDFKAPFIEKEPTKSVRKQLRRLEAHADDLFAQLYPTFKSTETRTSFRPMITGPEPLHFDTYEGATLVTAYINVSPVPRVYNIGPNFAELIKDQPDVMKHLLYQNVRSSIDLSYAIRQRTADGLPPLGPEAPRHHVKFAPGSIWFFNAKTVSHEVIYGAGALGISWEVPDCGAATQADLLKGL